MTCRHARQTRPGDGKIDLMPCPHRGCPEGTPAEVVRVGWPPLAPWPATPSEVAETREYVREEPHPGFFLWRQR